MNALRTIADRTVCCLSTVIVLGATTLCSLPAQANNATATPRPVVGATHQWEYNLDRQLTGDYNSGLIDNFELAALRRDLDGIKVQEEELRMDHGGLCARDEMGILNKLDNFQNILQRSVEDKVIVISQR